MPSPSRPARSRTRGARTTIGPMPVTISRSGRWPWRTKRRRPSSVSLSAWFPRNAATSASMAWARRERAPLRSTSVSGSENVPGWESLKTLLSVTAYRSFGGEVEARTPPRYAAFTPSRRHQLPPIALRGEREGGLTASEAILAACLSRFRPILAITATVTLGALPLALGMGAGSEVQRPLGIAVAGGVLVAQLATMYMTPVIYVRLAELCRRRPAHLKT